MRVLEENHKKIQIEYEIKLLNGSHKSLEEFIKKLCETHKEEHELHIKVIMSY